MFRFLQTELAALLYVNNVVDGSGRFYTKGLTGELLSVKLDTVGSVSALAEAEDVSVHGHQLSLFSEGVLNGS